MIVASVLAVLGVFLSAFFSGSETGFYRINRVRLTLDSLAGDRVARALWWMANRPSLFVATTLVGNNLANYLVSLSIVMGVQGLALRGHWPEVAAPILLAPVLFVYGELLPKNLFYHAPNRLLRLGAPLFLTFSVLFAPLSALLWGLSRLLELVAGQWNPQVKLALARQELQSVFEEGHEAGVLLPGQRRLAQGLFAVANTPVRRFTTPANRVVRVRLDMTKAEVLRLARRHRISAIPVEEPLGRRKLIGYVRVADVRLDPSDRITTVRTLMEIPDSEPHIAALVKMHNAGESLARVVDADGATVGVVNARRLADPLFRGGG